jgi:hypothetical protein
MKADAVSAVQPVGKAGKLAGNSFHYRIQDLILLFAFFFCLSDSFRRFAERSIIR